MASTQKRANSCEVEEEEYEDYEEVEIEEEVEGEDYEEVFEEEEVEEEEEEIELNEEEGGDEKKVVEVQKVREEDESVQDPAREEEKSTNPKQSWELEGNPLPLPAVFPSLLQSVSDLEKLRCALSTFLYQWNSLNRSLDLITAAIDAHASSQHDACLTEEEKDQRSEQEKDERTDQAKKKDGRSCVEILCEEMEANGLRKYIESNLSDIDLLRHEVPEALRRIPNPKKLVFDAIGKFYTQGRSAYHNNMPFVLHRRASILLLEFFVLSGRPTGDSSVKGEAKHGAFLWWKRLVNENIKSASAVDSLGLVLFLACFGIPKDFGSKDLCTLLLKSNLQNKIDVFRRSSILVDKIPGVIKDLIRGEMYYEAAELSCSFGLTDTFPPLPLLSSFVAKVIQIGKLERQRSRRFPNSVRQADIRELKSLRSVVKFLEDHKFDTDDLASVNIHKRISELEKYIERDATRLQNKIRKRKAQHLEFKDTKSEARSKESFSSTPRTPQNAPSQMIQNKPEIELPSQPDSKVENSAPSVAGGDTKEHRYGWERRTYFDSSACYRWSAMNCSSAQKFYQPQTSAHGNGSVFSGRDLYKFADTVEAQLSKSIRSRNTSPGGAKLGH